MRRRDVLRFASIALALGFGFVGAASGQDRQGFLIGTGAPGGVYYPLGGAICSFFNLNSDRHGLRCAAAISAGSVANIEALRVGRIDAAIVQSDVLADAVRGAGPFAASGPWSALRVVLVAHDEPFTVVARPEAGIKSSADLAGKRVNIGNPGSGHRLKMERVMAASGTTRDEFAEILELDPQEQVRALCEGRVDAIVYAVGHPSGLIQEAVGVCGGRIVPVTGKRIRAMLDGYHEYREMMVPGGLYAEHPADLPTFGTSAAVVVAAETDELAVYELTKSVFDEFEEFVRLHPALTKVQVRSAAGGLEYVPLHPGAERYYRERGLRH